MRSYGIQSPRVGKREAEEIRAALREAGWRVEDEKMVAPSGHRVTKAEHQMLERIGQDEVELA